MIPYLIAHQVNAQVNESTTYRSDLDAYAKPDFWSEADGTGDCEDYALAKRKMLRQQGYGDFCHLALCWTSAGEYHAVLLVETDEGWFVLDNRHSHPIEKQMTGYRWDKAEKSGSWHSLS